MDLRRPLLPMAMMICFAPALCGCAQTPSLKRTYQNDFLIGVALGGTLPTDYGPAELAVIRGQFNAVTPENCMKPGLIHPGQDTWNFAQADALVNFAQENHMQIFGHTLLWHHETPDWFFQDDAKPASREKILARLKNHIQTLVGRYKGKIRGWDVVNEAIANEPGRDLRKTPWLDSLGEDYLIQAYRFAHEADPAAELQYNDYGIESPPKRQKAIRLIKRLQAAGIPLAAVGIQGHWILDRVPFADIDQAIDQFHALGVKVNISELDLDVLPRHSGAEVNPTGADNSLATAATRPLPEIFQRQAEQYAKLFALFHKHRDAITRVTFWGLSDGRSWLNDYHHQRRIDYPLLFDRQSQPKPAFYAVIDVLANPATRP